MLRARGEFALESPSRIAQKSFPAGRGHGLLAMAVGNPIMPVSCSSRLAAAQTVGDAGHSRSCARGEFASVGVQNFDLEVVKGKLGNRGMAMAATNTIGNFLHVRGQSGRQNPIFTAQARKFLQVSGLRSQQQVIANSLKSSEQAGSNTDRDRFSSLTSLGKNAFLLALPGFAGFNVGLEGTESVLQAVGVLTLIIIVHECGHFLAARLQNIHVSKFSIGFGPKLAKFQRKNVEYSLRAIPLGGYVGFPDDDPDSEFTPDDPNLLKNRPMLDRVLVMSAGVAANVVFAYTLLFTQTLTVGFLQQQLLPGVVVPDVVSNYAAARAGVKPGDLILAVDGHALFADEHAVGDVVDVIKNKPGQKLTLLIRRGLESLNIDIVPDKSKEGLGRIGVQLSLNSKTSRIKAKDLAEATVQASTEFWKLTGRVLDGLFQIVVNFAQTAGKLSGPVAIVAVGAEVARSDVAGLFQFAAILNINLAVVNILPLPALDGGYLALIALEAARGKKLPNKVEQGIMSSGILLILALGIVLMVRDTLNLGFIQERL